MARPHIVLTRDGYVQSVTLDGERLSGVRSVEILNTVGRFPVVRIEIIAQTITADLKPTFSPVPEPIWSAEELEAMKTMTPEDRAAFKLELMKRLDAAL